MPLDIDRFAHLETSIHRWDPRIKILSLGIFMFGVAVLKTIPLVIIALVAAMIFLKITGLPFHFIYHGMKWVVFFLAPFFVIMPLSYPGEAAFHIWIFPFAWEGLRLATLIFIKAIAIVMTTYSIFGSARFDISMITLQQLKCPKVIVQMLLFTYRYIFVFIEEMKRMDTAMRCRGFVMKTDVNTLRVMGNFVGTLLVRSFERTSRVYKAMLSKGYEGEFHTLVVFRARWKDFVKAALVVGVIIAILAGDLFGIFRPAVEGWY